MVFYLPFLKLQQALNVGGHYENITHLSFCVGTSSPVLTVWHFFLSVLINRFYIKVTDGL